MIRLLSLFFVLLFIQSNAQSLFEDDFDTTSALISTTNWPVGCRSGAPSMNTNTANCSVGNDYAVALKGINSRIISLPILIPSNEYEITFEYAYKETSGTPALEILSGSGCGTSFESANGLSSTGDTCKSQIFDLASFSGKKLIFCFSSKSATDTFFLDNIKVCHKSSCDILNSLHEFSNKIEMYPNPTSDFLSIVTTENTLIEIINSSGTIVQNHSLSGNSEIDISSLDKGLYIIRFKSDSGWFSKKIVIE